MSTFETPPHSEQLRRRDEVNQLELRSNAFFQQFTTDIIDTVVRLMRQHFESNVPSHLTYE